MFVFLEPYLLTYCSRDPHGTLDALDVWMFVFLEPYLLTVAGIHTEHLTLWMSRETKNIIIIVALWSNQANDPE